MDDPFTNTIVVKNNQNAVAIMTKHGVKTVDLNSPILKACGPVPQASCFGQKGCWSPHCPPAYSWLTNTTILPAIKALL